MVSRREKRRRDEQWLRRMMNRIGFRKRSERKIGKRRMVLIGVLYVDGSRN